MDTFCQQESRFVAQVATGPVTVGALQAGEEAAWNAWVDRSPSATFFHRLEWKGVIEGVLGRKCFYLAARRNGAITGVLPMSHARSRIFGDSLVSLPLTVYGGVCADDEESYRALLQAGGDLARQLGVQYLELRNRTEPYATSLPGRDLYTTFTQDLTPGPEKLMKALPRDTRYSIRKGIKAGLAWTEDLAHDEFYEMYAQSVHRLGTPVFPRQLFPALCDAFGKKARLFAVRKEGKAIAGVLCFYFRDQVLPYYAGALMEYYRDSPNNFMYWSLMEQSANQGIREFDFGRSKKGTGAYDFKCSWNMTMTELPYRYVLVKAREVPQMSAADKKFERPVAAWKRLPYPLTKIIGPHLIRRIPSI